MGHVTVCDGEDEWEEEEIEELTPEQVEIMTWEETLRAANDRVENAKKFQEETRQKFRQSDFVKKHTTLTDDDVMAFRAYLNRRPITLSRPAYDWIGSFLADRMPEIVRTNITVVMDTTSRSIGYYVDGHSRLLPVWATLFLAFVKLRTAAGGYNWSSPVNPGGCIAELDRVCAFLRLNTGA